MIESVPCCAVSSRSGQVHSEDVLPAEHPSPMEPDFWHTGRLATEGGRFLPAEGKGDGRGRSHV